MRNDYIRAALSSLDTRLTASHVEEPEHTHVCLDCGTLEVASCGTCGSYARNEDVLLGRGLLDDVAAVARERGVPLEEAFRLLVLAGLVLAGRGDASATAEVARLLDTEPRTRPRLVPVEA
jgi:hypothetical protein